MRFRLKPGMGKHHMRGRDGKRIVLRPGDTIDCDPLDLGGAAVKFEQLDPDPIELPPPAGSEYRVVPAPGGIGFNVLHAATGEPLNDEPMTAQEAADLAGVAVETLAESGEPKSDVSETTPVVDETTGASPGGPVTDEA